MADRNTVVGVDFVAAGAVIAALGYALARNIPIAALGFSLATVGAVILLTVPEPVPRDVLQMMLGDAVRNLDALLADAGLREKAYYLVAGEDVKAFVPLNPEGGAAAGPPSPDGWGDAEKLLEHARLIQSQLSSKQVNMVAELGGVKGLVFTPPVNQLVKLAKIAVGDDVEEAVRTVVVEQSGLGSSVLVAEDPGRSLVRVQIKTPAVEAQAPSLERCLGSVAASAAACAVAKARGGPVVFWEELGDKALTRVTLIAPSAPAGAADVGG